MWFPCHVHGCWFCNVRIWDGNLKKCISNLVQRTSACMQFQELCSGLVGYNLAYGIPEGGYIGTFMPWSDASAIDTGYSDGSDWFFQNGILLQPQFQFVQVQWLKELNYGHSFYFQQF